MSTKLMSVALEIEGTADLIPINFGAEALNTDGLSCVTPLCLKSAILSACRYTKKFKKTQLRTLILIDGQSIPITYRKMGERVDKIGLPGGKPYVRRRPLYVDWMARFIVQFSDILSVQTVMDLVNRAGAGGIGEWRPERDGTFGTFIVLRDIKDHKEIAEVREACAVPLVPFKVPKRETIISCGKAHIGQPAVKACPGADRSGGVSLGMAAAARHGGAMPGRDWRGPRGKDRTGKASPGANNRQAVPDLAKHEDITKAHIG